MKNLLFKRLLGVSLLLIVCTNSIWANTDNAVAFDKLKLGDWFVLNNTKPINSIGEEFSSTWKGTVTNSTKDEVTIEFVLTNLFHKIPSNEGATSTSFYIDTDFRMDGDFISKDRDKIITDPPKITMTTSLLTNDLPSIDITRSDTTRYYGIRDYIHGLKNTRDKGSSGTYTGRELHINDISEQIKSWLLQDKTTSISNCNIVDASFALKPNTFVFYKLDGYAQLDNPKMYDNQLVYKSTAEYLKKENENLYSISIFLDKPIKRWVEGSYIWLSPGDSLVISKDKDRNVTFSGQGAEICRVSYKIDEYIDDIHNNFHHGNTYKIEVDRTIKKIEQLYDELLYPNESKISRYWYTSALLSLDYIKSSAYFIGSYNGSRLRKSIDDWGAPVFNNICPILDYKFQPEYYQKFIREFYTYNSVVLNDNNMTDKAYFGEDRNAFYLMKLLLSGYPQSSLWLKNLTTRLQYKSVSELKDEFTIFYKYCYNPGLRAEAKKLEVKYSKFENTRNIKDVKFDFMKKLPLQKRCNGYILLHVSKYTSSLEGLIFSSIDSELKEANLKESVEWVIFRPKSEKDKFDEEDLKDSKGFGYIWEESTDFSVNVSKYGISNEQILILRNDGTIIGRVSIESPESGIVDIILKDKEEAATAPLLSRTQLYLILGAFTVLVTIFGIYYNSRIRKQKLQTKLSQLKLKAIRSQMNPHFIFNALTSIQSLILRSDIEQSNHYLTTFSRMLRNVLTSSEKTLIPLASELELIEQYLQIEQLRMPISYNLVVADNICTDSIEIPGMLLQPIVENAVIHGLFPQQGGQIDIKLWLEENSLWCNIIDNGVGLNKSSDSKSTFGLNSIQERLTLLNDSKATQVKLNITNRLDKEGVSGCRVVITIPL